MTKSDNANWNLRFSYFLALIWVAIQVVAVVRHKRRGLWLLIGLPIVLWWPIVFRMMEYACHIMGMPACKDFSRILSDNAVPLPLTLFQKAEA